MKIDENKLRELMARYASLSSPDELRREKDVFLVGGNLPGQQTIATLFDSHYQSNASLFHLAFGSLSEFSHAESLARLIKKNFHAHLLGQVDFPVPARLVERAYAAGVDIIDIPLASLQRNGNDYGGGVEERLEALHFARSVFPRWSVVSTLLAGAEPVRNTVERIDTLLSREVVPLVMVAADPTSSFADLSEIFSHLSAGWRAHRVTLKPLLPLVQIASPLVPASSGGVLRGFIDLIHGRQLLATSDLRRVLRVKEVEESFESSGL